MKHFRLRRVALEELITTEASYVKHLHALLTIYVLPLTEAANAGHRTPPLSAAEVRMMYPNMEHIYRINHQFLCDLIQTVDSAPVPTPE